MDENDTNTSNGREEEGVVTPIKQEEQPKENVVIKNEPETVMDTEAMKLAVISGRKSYLSGRINPNLFGSASTTNKGII